MSGRLDNEIGGERSSANPIGPTSSNVLSDTSSRNEGFEGERNSRSADGPSPLDGRFTLVLECERLLKPDSNRPGVYISLSGEEIVKQLQLSTLLPIPILDQIKIKMFHTCGPIEFDEGSCLTALWNIGAWFVARYRESGRPARYETLERGRDNDWTQPDATVVVFID